MLILLSSNSVYKYTLGIYNLFSYIGIYFGVFLKERFILVFGRRYIYIGKFIGHFNHSDHLIIYILFS